MAGDGTALRDRFEESYWRAATATVGGRVFADSFYDRFLARSEDVRKLFQGTDFPVQKRMFTLAILYVSSAYEKPRSGRVLEQLARRHRNVGVRPEMFDLWMDCLLETVREFDPEWDETVAETWRAVMAPGLRHLAEACAR
jgi:hemoglobin-like flavoprotein